MEGRVEWGAGVRREREKRKNFEWFFQNSRKQTSFHSAELVKMLMVGEGGRLIPTLPSSDVRIQFQPERFSFLISVLCHLFNTLC